MRNFNSDSLSTFVSTMNPTPYESSLDSNSDVLPAVLSALGSALIINMGTMREMYNKCTSLIAHGGDEREITSIMYEEFKFLSPNEVEPVINLALFCFAQCKAENLGRVSRRTLKTCSWVHVTLNTGKGVVWTVVAE